jgi:hypothetical protein
MTPSRTRGKPIFDPSALGQDLDDMWPTPKRAAAAPLPERPAVAVPPQAALTPVSSSPAVSPALDPAPASVSDSSTHPRPRLAVTARTTAATADRKRARPPEVLLAAEVYDELYRVQIAEKKARRGLARTMGTIVLDAIEAHALRLQSTWAAQEYAVGEGQLFERPASTAVPRRRRHATTPRTVVLSGVTAANGQRLDGLVEMWGAGTRSALVEQALRYEFDLLPTVVIPRRRSQRQTAQ